MIGSLKLSDYRCPITANCPIVILQINLSKIYKRALDWTTSTRLSTSTSLEFQTSDVVGALALHVGFRKRE